MVTRWQVPDAPARAGKSTMLGVQAPKAAPVAHSTADDSWDVAPTHVEERAHQTAPAATPTPLAVTPVAPAPAPMTPAPAPAGLNAADVRLIVRTIVEDALLPLQRALVEAQQRIADLERRPAPTAPTVILSAAPAPAAVAPSAYTSATPFDGARRRRRMAWFVVLALLAIFGGLFALLADSYTPHH